MLYQSYERRNCFLQAIFPAGCVLCSWHSSIKARNQQVYDTAPHIARHVGMFMTQLYKSTSFRHVHNTSSQKHVMSACSWHNSTKARHVGKFKTQLHTKPLWFLSLLVHYSSISDWDSVRLYGQGFRYCPKQNGNSHKMCELQTHNGKVEEIKHQFATLTRDKSSIF